jgi:hypothetical protein
MMGRRKKEPTFIERLGYDLTDHSRQLAERRREIAIQQHVLHREDLALTREQTATARARQKLGLDRGDGR